MDTLLIIPFPPFTFTVVSRHKNDERQRAAATERILKSTGVLSCTDSTNTEKDDVKERVGQKMKVMI